MNHIFFFALNPSQNSRLNLEKGLRNQAVSIFKHLVPSIISPNPSIILPYFLGSCSYRRSSTGLMFIVGISSVSHLNFSLEGYPLSAYTNITFPFSLHSPLIISSGNILVSASCDLYCLDIHETFIFIHPRLSLYFFLVLPLSLSNRSPLLRPCLARYTPSVTRSSPISS